MSAGYFVCTSLPLLQSFRALCVTADAGNPQFSIEEEPATAEGMSGPRFRGLSSVAQIGALERWQRVNSSTAVEWFDEADISPPWSEPIGP